MNVKTTVMKNYVLFVTLFVFGACQNQGNGDKCAPADLASVKGARANHGAFIRKSPTFANGVFKEFGRPMVGRV